MSGFFLHRIGSIVIPRHCAVCGLRSGEREICGGCLADLPWIHRACHGCGMPLAGSGVAQLGCGRCQGQPWPFSFVRTPLRYAFPVSGLLKAFKYQRRTFIAPALATLLYDALAGHTANIEALLPVPLHWARHRERGFNQAAELARPLARRLGLPLWQEARRVRRTAPQSGLTDRDRQRNLAGAFAVRDKPAYRSVLIVDDVITTGATVRQLARTLQLAGVEELAVVAVARAVAGKA